MRTRAITAILICMTLAPAAYGSGAAQEPLLPHLAGTLPAVEQSILGTLQRAGLADRVVRIAADTNGHITVASLVFTYRLTGSTPQDDLQEYAWRLVTATLASAVPLDEVDLTGFHDQGAPFDAMRRDVTFTAAVSAQELAQIPAGTPERQAFRLLPRVWTDPALHAPPAAGSSDHRRRERGVTFSGDPAERAVESAHQQLGQQSGMVVEGKLYRGNRLSPRLALTFDDGPAPLYTPLLLDTLDRIGIKATFFLIGLRVQQYPYFARAIAQHGHELGNHSFHHRNLARLSEADARGELAAAQRTIEQVTGVLPRFFRPPGGDYSAGVLRAAHDLDLITVFWTDDPGDYARPSGALLENILLARVSNGGILLLHQGVRQTIDILPQTVEVLRRERFVLTTVGGLLAGTGRSP